MKEKTNNTVHIHKIQDAIGNTSMHLMFLHAFTGCDTVSAVY